MSIQLLECLTACWRSRTISAGLFHAGSSALWFFLCGFPSSTLAASAVSVCHWYFLACSYHIAGRCPFSGANLWSAPGVPMMRLRVRDRHWFLRQVHTPPVVSQARCCAKDAWRHGSANRTWIFPLPMARGLFRRGHITCRSRVVFLEAHFDRAPGACSCGDLVWTDLETRFVVSVSFPLVRTRRT